MKNENVSISRGIGFNGLLALLFIGLKLTGYIDWSWVWVLAPLWLPLAVFLVVVTVGIIFSTVILGILSIFKRKE